METKTSPVFVIELGCVVETNQDKKSSEKSATNENNDVIIDKSMLLINKCSQSMTKYVKKFRGLKKERPQRLPWDEYLWSFIGSLLGMAAVGFLHYRLVTRYQLLFLTGSFGATAVIIFTTPSSPLAQPRNLICGHLIGAVCGCILRIAIKSYAPAMASALAVSLSIIIMQFTETLHPPGGATALLTVTIEQSLPWAHFQFIFIPILSGAFVMLVVALIVNNLAPKRNYPSFWW